MGFVADGRYVLVPVGVQEAEEYVDLQIFCLGETYGSMMDPGFAERHRQDRENLLAEFRENVSVAGARAFFAYEVPGWTPEADLSCVVGQEVDWGSPVGLGLSRPGPLSWEAEMPVDLPPAGLRELTQLYTFASTHGTGLGQAMFDALIYPDEDAYLWVVRGNDRGIRFYEKNGFVVEGLFFPCGGVWTPEPEIARTLPPEQLGYSGRMFRYLQAKDL